METKELKLYHYNELLEEAQVKAYNSYIINAQAGKYLDNVINTVISRINFRFRLGEEVLFRMPGINRLHIGYSNKTRWDDIKGEELQNIISRFDDWFEEEDNISPISKDDFFVKRLVHEYLKPIKEYQKKDNKSNITLLDLLYWCSYSLRDEIRKIIAKTLDVDFFIEEVVPKSLFFKNGDMFIEEYE